MTPQTDSSIVFVLRIIYSYWVSATFAASIDRKLFTFLNRGPASVDAIAAGTSMTPRTAQALLDALSGMGLVQRNDDETYQNTHPAATHLVEGRPEYLGPYSAMIQATWSDWEKLSEVVARGRPLHRHESANPANAFWEHMVRALAPLCYPPARAGAERLGIGQRGAFHMLDIGGGAGAFSVVWLGLNRNARSDQLDWPNVNAIAREYVQKSGHGDRFTAIDGDMELVSLEEAKYDYVIYSNVAHGISADRNIAMFRRLHRALKPGGVMMIVGLLPNNVRAGDPLLLMFNMNMILNTEEGATHLSSEYEHWLSEAGYSAFEFHPMRELPFTIVYATW